MKPLYENTYFYVAKARNGFEVIENKSCGGEVVATFHYSGDFAFNRAKQECDNRAIAKQNVIASKSYLDRRLLEQQKANDMHTQVGVGVMEEA